jgi:hypothetical protein
MPSTGASTTSGRPATSQCAITLPSTTRPSGCGASASCSSVPSRWSSANSRGSESIVASSAATHSTPGASRRSCSGSGPDAERKQADDDDEEEDRGDDVGLSAHREAQVAADDGADQGQHAIGWS